MDMILKYARGISYSQLYKNEEDNVANLISGLPTCESVMWLSFLVHQKITFLKDYSNVSSFNIIWLSRSISLYVV